MKTTPTSSTINFDQQIVIVDSFLLVDDRTARKRVLSKFLLSEEFGHRLLHPFLALRKVARNKTGRWLVLLPVNDTLKVTYTDTIVTTHRRFLRGRGKVSGWGKMRVVGGMMSKCETA